MVRVSTKSTILLLLLLLLLRTLCTVQTYTTASQTPCLAHPSSGLCMGLSDSLPFHFAPCPCQSVCLLCDTGASQTLRLLSSTPYSSTLPFYSADGVVCSLSSLFHAVSTVHSMGFPCRGPITARLSPAVWVPLQLVFYTPPPRPSPSVSTDDIRRALRPHSLFLHRPSIHFSPLHPHRRLSN